jgi:hypothetical protein
MAAIAKSSDGLLVALLSDKNAIQPIETNYLNLWQKPQQMF